MEIRRKPLTTGIMALIASVGCIAVGFSSWSISLGGGSGNANGTITADDIESGTYFSASIQTADVNSYGFITNDTVTSNGKFQLKYTIKNYNSLIGISSSMTFNFTLDYATSIGEQDIFNSAYCSSALDSSTSSNVSGYTYSFGEDHLSVEGHFTVAIPSTYSQFGANVNFAFSDLTFTEEFATSLASIDLSLTTQVTIN